MCLDLDLQLRGFKLLYAIFCLCCSVISINPRGFYNTDFLLLLPPRKPKKDRHEKCIGTLYIDERIG